MIYPAVVFFVLAHFICWFRSHSSFDAVSITNSQHSDKQSAQYNIVYFVVLSAVNCSFPKYMNCNWKDLPKRTWWKCLQAEDTREFYPGYLPVAVVSINIYIYIYIYVANVLYILKLLILNINFACLAEELLPHVSLIPETCRSLWLWPGADVLTSCSCRKGEGWSGSGSPYSQVIFRMNSPWA
jgi:hypothetical protein